MSTEQKKEKRYYKLICVWDGNGQKSTDYFDDLTQMVIESWHLGVKSYPVVAEAVEISKEEYDKNYLPI